MIIVKTVKNEIKFKVIIRWLAGTWQKLTPVLYDQVSSQHTTGHSSTTENC